jgi:hypothetical protein
LNELLAAGRLKLFLAEGEAVGYALKKNFDEANPNDTVGKWDLINVFNNSGIPGRGSDAIIDGIVNGAETLDCFGEHLSETYAQYGFVETDEAAWNKAYAPDNWNYERDKTPNVYFMAYPGELSRDRTDVRRRFEAARSARDTGRRSEQSGVSGSGSDVSGRSSEDNKEKRSEEVPPDARGASGQLAGVFGSVLTSELSPGVFEVSVELDGVKYTRFKPVNMSKALGGYAVWTSPEGPVKDLKLKRRLQAALKKLRQQVRRLHDLDD